MSNTVKAKSWLPRVTVAKTMNGGPPLIVNVPVAASQTLYVGTPVTISGSVISIMADTDPQIYGICMGNVTTTAADEGTVVPVAVADRNTIFMAQVITGTASSAIAIGEEVDLDVAATTAYIEDATSEGHIIIVDRVPGDDTSDTTNSGRLLFTIKRSQFDDLIANK